MEFLTTPKSAYLLQGSLDVLHFESREWQEEISFIQDEAYFLRKLLRKYQEKYLSEMQSKNLTLLEERLKTLTANAEQMNMFIQKHEQYLANIIQDKTYSSDKTYRQKHRTAKAQTESLFQEFKTLKKNIYHLIEDFL